MPARGMNRLSLKIPTGVVIVVVVLAAFAGVASASRVDTSQWNWVTHGSPAYSGCGKSSIHVSGDPVSTGYAYSWVVSGTNCASTKQAAWVSASAMVRKRSGSTWTTCGITGAPPRQWTTLSIIPGENEYGCSGADAWALCGQYEAEIWFTVFNSNSSYPLCAVHEGNS